MSPEQLKQRLTAAVSERLPFPGGGGTAARHRRLMEIGREDLSLAKLAEAHWDATAILDEAGRQPEAGALYGVWASEIPGKALHVDSCGEGFRMDGVKSFCSGMGLIDRALITAGTSGQLLIELNLRKNRTALEADGSGWATNAFRLTQTSTVTFHAAEVEADAIVGDNGWYSNRPGFWHGACGPAACWAGGVAGLLDFAMGSSRDDPHTLAHLAAIDANMWATRCYLETAGNEIDRDPSDVTAARIRALEVRHLVEQACTDTLRRFVRAYGPYPISMNSETVRRYGEADLYMRQSHAERDLESLGRAVQERRRAGPLPD